MKILLSVALGGAVGASARYLVGGLIGTSIGVQRLGYVGLRRTLAAVVLFAGIKMVVIAPGHQGPDPVTDPRESAKLP